MGLSTVPNNGVRVQGLRVLHSCEHRRLARWWNLASLLVDSVPVLSDDWHVLTVTDHDGGIEARRRFEKSAAADHARAAFVARVAALNEDELDVADLQGLLDVV
jgi:hypothetical protein